MRLIITFTLAIFHLALIGQTWVQKASLPANGRLAAVAFPIGNKGYIGAGNTYSGYTDDFWEYDPATDSWTQKANFLGGPRNFALGFSIGVRGYFGCGTNGMFQNDFWEYDPVANTWTQKANMGGVIRATASGFSVGGYGYIGTGFDWNANCLADFWRYDPANNTWTQMGNFSGGKRIDVDRATFVIGNKAYWGTGWDQATGVKYNDWWEYNSTTDTWSQKANIPTLGRWGAIGFSICNKGFVGMGIYNGTSVPYTDFWQYDPTTNFWTFATSFPMPGRTDASVIVLNNKAYIGTGMDTSLTLVNGQWEWTLYNDWWEFSMGASVSVTAIPDTICLGSSTTIIATGGSSYSWNTGATTSSIVVSPTATTSYSAIDPTSSCASAGNITVVVLQSSAATISGSTSICSGQSATLTASGGGTYSWIPGGQTTSSVIVTPTVTTTYSAVVANSCGTTTVSATVTISSGVVAIVSGNTSLCSGQSATLNASGGNNYSWNTGATSSFIVVTPTASTSYSVSVSSGLCSDDTSILVTVSPMPVVSAGNASICIGDAATLIASGGGTYSWIPGGQTTSSIIVSPTSSTAYNVVVANGCGTTTVSATVSIVAAITASVSGSTLLCIGQTTTLTASGGNIFSWNTGMTTSSIVVTPSSNTSYSVSVSSGSCADDTSISVTVSPPPSASASSATICSGDVATLTASGGGNYLWSNGATTSSIAASVAGNYSVVVSIGNCSDTTSANLTVNPNPIVNAGSNATITQGASTTLSVTGGGAYNWNNGSTDAAITVSPNVTTMYCVTVTNANGCVDSACISVFVIIPIEPLDCSTSSTGELFLPNAFSPNGDGENDVIKIFYGNYTCIKTFRLLIYNRWGEKVFETFDPVSEWDGSYRGQTEGSFVFAYYMKATLTSGEEVIKKGNISLIK
ncbi:MAG: gliding motility-associated C-terminal domain-containing protein [Bacteroidetes bacterium]|nr:gliding motility-associated C-terminal domain-containing protein [Bacteroidota bacterium]